MRLRVPQWLKKGDPSGMLEGTNSSEPQGFSHPHKLHPLLSHILLSRNPMIGVAGGGLSVVLASPFPLDCRVWKARGSKGWDILFISTLSYDKSLEGQPVLLEEDLGTWNPERDTLWWWKPILLGLSPSWLKYICPCPVLSLCSQRSVLCTEWSADLIATVLKSGQREFSRLTGFVFPGSLIRAAGEPTP